MNKGVKKIIVFGSAVLLFTIQQVMAATFPVTNTNDAGAGSLRQAIIDANANPGADVIDATGITGTINLLSVLPNINESVTISGPGMNLLTINQTIDRRVFTTGSGAVIFLLQDLTLNFTGPGTTPYSGGGGAILAGGAGASTTLINVTISNFQYQIGNGGAISASSSLNNHSLTLTNCIFLNNKCGGGGGAVSYNSQGGTAIITGCVFSGNQTGPVGANTGGDGGALNTSGGGSGGTYLVEKNTFINNQVLNNTGHAGAVMSTNGTLTLRYNRFVNNTCANTSFPPLANVVGQAGGATTHVTIADNNWWGVNTGPGTNDATALAAGAVMTLTKWLQLKTTASPNPICASTPSNLGNTSTVTTSFLSNSASEAIAVGNLTSLIGLPVIWGPTTLGSLSGQQGTIQASGTATALFTSNGTGGTATVNTQVDNIPVNETSPARANITVNTLSTTPTLATGAATICYGTTTTLTVTGGIKGTGAVTQWYTGSCGGTLVFTGDAFTTPALTTTTTYYVRYSGDCNTTTCATVIVTVLPQVNYGTIVSPSVSHLVISQVYGGGGNSGAPYTHDFIEIFNPTGTSINVNGWSVQYAPPASSTWVATNLSGSVAPGKYYLIQQSSGGASGVALPTPDATGSIAMALGAGKVALVNSTTVLTSCTEASIVDKVGYGTTSVTCNETSNASAPSNTTSILRANNGCIDTDNNSSDFSTGAPNPRNSATAANLCATTLTVCSGTIPGSMSVTGASGGSGTFTYQWYSRSGVICPTGTDISGWTPLGAGDGTGFNTTTFTPTLGVTDDKTFACLVTPAGSPVCPPPAWANGCRVVMVNNVTGGTIAASQALCAPADPAEFTESAASTGDGMPLTYQWQYSSVSDFSSDINTIAGAEATTYDPPPGLNSTRYYRRVTKSLLNNVECTAFSNILSVSINTLSTEPTGATGTTTICNGGSTTLTVTGGSKGTGAITEWFTGSCGGTPAGTGDAITVSPAITTVYYVRYNGDCNTTGCATVTVTVNTLSTEPTGATGTTTICNGGSTTLTVAGGSKGTGAITEWFTGSCGGTPAGTGDAITVSPATTTVYYVRYNGDCNTTSCATVTVTVNTLSTEPTGATGITSICNGGSTTLTVSGGSKGTGAITEWFTGSCGGTPAGTGDAITVSPSVMTTYYVRYNGTCNTTNCATVTVNIIPDNSITLSSAAGTDAQTVLVNTPITDITYATTGATGASFLGLPAGVNGAWVADVVTISGTPTVLGTFNYTVTLTGGCGTVTATGSINVITCSISLSSAAGTDAQTLCSNTAIDNITYATTGATGASFLNLPTGVTGAWSANTATISGTPVVSGVFNYSVMLIGGGCESYSAGGTITVNEMPTISCSGDQVVNSTPGSCSAVVNYNSSSTGIPAPEITYAFTGATAGSGSGNGSGSTFNVGVTTVSLTASNTCGTVSCSFTVTVIDNQPPVITFCPADKTSASDAGLCTKTFTAAQIGTATASDNCPSHTINWARSDAAPNLTDPFPFGITTITWTATDASGNTAECIQTINVNKVTATTQVTVSPSTRQYSDKVTFVATVTPSNCAGAGPIGGTVTFKIGTLTMGTAPVLADGTATLADVALLEPSLDPGNPPNGPLKPGVKTVTAVYSGTDDDYELSNPTTSLTITCEDARVYYTGACYASTSGATSSNAIVTLSATIRDITAEPGEPDYDANAGDIRNATVTFINRDNNTVIAAGVPVGLVNPGDLKVGTATYNWNTTITGDAEQFTIGIIVNNYYCRNSSDDNTVITVSKPLSGYFISGGGYLVLTNSAGIKAGRTGSKNNFGFNIKFNKSGKNLQGNINTIVRRTEGGIMRVYQIKGNAMTSLAVNENCPKTATFNGKANIKDITDPLNPISIEGNATLQVKMTDMGEPGSSDKIAITVWNKDGGLWFASNWNGTTTVEQVLGGGNLKVHGGASCDPDFSESNNLITNSPKETLIVSPENNIFGSENFKVMVYPNPSQGEFTIRVESRSSEAIIVRLMDIRGDVKEVSRVLSKTAVIKMGATLVSGNYFAEIIQGTNKQILKLVKLN